MKLANRSVRRHLANLVRNGVRPLYVTGNTKYGFRLACRLGESYVIIGPVAGFRRQKDAVAYGETKLGVKAKKVKVVNSATAR